MEAGGFDLGDLLAAQGDDICLARPELGQARAFLRDKQKGDGLELGDTIAPVAVHGFKLDGGADGILRDPVGAAADRFPSESIGPHLLKILLGQDHALSAGRTREVPGQEDRWLLQVDDERGGVLDLDLFERGLRRTQEGCHRLRIEEAVKAEFHILRRELRAIVKQHALP